MTKQEQQLLCYCGNILFFDFEEGKWLCPSRFDGEHSLEQEHTYEQARLTQLNNARLAGSIGGTRRAQALTPERRTAIATHAANTRWKKEILK